MAKCELTTVALILRISNFVERAKSFHARLFLTFARLFIPFPRLFIPFARLFSHSRLFIFRLC